MATTDGVTTTATMLAAALRLAREPDDEFMSTGGEAIGAGVEEQFAAACQHLAQS